MTNNIIWVEKKLKVDIDYACIWNKGGTVMSNLMDKNLFDRIKVVQYESIPVVKDMECPNCHKSDCNGFLKERANPIGWCDTQLGLMAVFECPKCFTKFRCHISSTGRWNKEAFYMDFALVHCLYNKI